MGTIALVGQPGAVVWRLAVDPTRIGPALVAALTVTVMLTHTPGVRYDCAG